MSSKDEVSSLDGFTLGNHLFVSNKLYKVAVSTVEGKIPLGNILLIFTRYCTSKNLSFAALQIGHVSGGSPMTVLPHIGHT